MIPLPIDTPRLSITNTLLVCIDNNYNLFISDTAPIITSHTGIVYDNPVIYKDTEFGFDVVLDPVVDTEYKQVRIAVTAHGEGPIKYPKSHKTRRINIPVVSRGEEGVWDSSSTTISLVMTIIDRPVKIPSCGSYFINVSNDPITITLPDGYLFNNDMNYTKGNTADIYFKRPVVPGGALRGVPDTPGSHVVSVYDSDQGINVPYNIVINDTRKYVEGDTVLCVLDSEQVEVDTNAVRMHESGDDDPADYFHTHSGNGDFITLPSNGYDKPIVAYPGWVDDADCPYYDKINMKCTSVSGCDFNYDVDRVVAPCMWMIRRNASEYQYDATDGISPKDSMPPTGAGYWSKVVLSTDPSMQFTLNNGTTGAYAHKATYTYKNYKKGSDSSCVKYDNVIDYYEYCKPYSKKFDRWTNDYGTYTSPPSMPSILSVDHASGVLQQGFYTHINISDQAKDQYKNLIPIQGVGIMAFPPSVSYRDFVLTAGKYGIASTPDGSYAIPLISGENSTSGDCASLEAYRPLTRYIIPFSDHDISCSITVDNIKYPAIEPSVKQRCFYRYSARYSSSGCYIYKGTYSNILIQRHSFSIDGCIVSRGDEYVNVDIEKYASAYYGNSRPDAVSYKAQQKDMTCLYSVYSIPVTNVSELNIHNMARSGSGVLDTHILYIKKTEKDGSSSSDTTSCGTGFEKIVWTPGTTFTVTFDFYVHIDQGKGNASSSDPWIEHLYYTIDFRVSASDTAEAVNGYAVWTTRGFSIDDCSIEAGSEYSVNIHFNDINASFYRQSNKCMSSVGLTTLNWLHEYYHDISWTRYNSNKDPVTCTDTIISESYEGEIGHNCYSYRRYTQTISNIKNAGSSDVGDSSSSDSPSYECKDYYISLDTQTSRMTFEHTCSVQGINDELDTSLSDTVLGITTIYPFEGPLNDYRQLLYSHQTNIYGTLIYCDNTTYNRYINVHRDRDVTTYSISYPSDMCSNISTTRTSTGSKDYSNSGTLVSGISTNGSELIIPGSDFVSKSPVPINVSLDNTYTFEANYSNSSSTQPDESSSSDLSGWLIRGYGVDLTINIKSSTSCYSALNTTGSIGTPSYDSSESRSATLWCFNGDISNSEAITSTSSDIKVLSNYDSSTKTWKSSGSVAYKTAVNNWMSRYKNITKPGTPSASSYTSKCVAMTYKAESTTTIRICTIFNSYNTAMEFISTVKSNPFVFPDPSSSTCPDIFELGTPSTLSYNGHYTVSLERPMN